MKRVFAILTVLAVLFSCSSGLSETILRDVMGTTDAEKGTYTNSFFGIGCSNPNWDYYRDEEILSLNEFTEESMETDLKTIIKYGKNVILMMSVPDTFDALDCVVIGVSKFVSWSVRDLIKKAGLEAALPGLRYDIIKQYQSYGMEDVEVQTDTVTIDGRDEAAFVVQFTNKGSPVRFVDVIVPYDDCFVIIEATAAYGDIEDAKTAFSSFYWLNEPEIQP